MTRFAIDAGVAIRLAVQATPVASDHQLVAPKSLQNAVLAELYREVRAGARDREAARRILNEVTTMHLRLLGDRVSRGQAWRIAEQLGWDDVAPAEYLAVAVLQADAFVTLDEKLAASVADVVPIAPFESLFVAG